MAGFNRTFMELKFKKQRNGIKRFSSFNRTFMELKSMLTSCAVPDIPF